MNLPAKVRAGEKLFTPLSTLIGFCQKISDQKLEAILKDKMFSINAYINTDKNIAAGTNSSPGFYQYK